MKNLTENIFLIILLFVSMKIYGDDKQVVGLDEKLGAKLPLDLTFTDEDGRKILLKDIIDKPTVIDFVYYNCPGICTPLMNEVANVIDKIDMQPGKDYNIISISIDETETPEIAARKKLTIAEMVEKDVTGKAWRFLTGDNVSIRKLTSTAGWGFKREGKQFIHSGALIFISKDGIICRYLIPDYSERRGFGILPFDFKMAIIETSQGKQMPMIAKVIQFCFSYDPKGRSYVFNFTRVFGAGILISASIFIIYLRVKTKKDKRTTR